ncbi:copper amine oxidase [Nitzschia inconspicua]|uniref:Amine oxidase n=1 Tax=Nitzschia inconspicua TaxID=303405 RepID=A0A9K3KWV8_9STRA|nr:copper amine oxidase [Nitzschia inconspicua]
MKIASWLLLVTWPSSCVVATIQDDSIGSAQDSTSNNGNIRGSNGSGNANEEEDLPTRKLQQYPGMLSFSPESNRINMRRDFKPRQSDSVCSACDNSFAGASVMADSREDIFNQLSVSEYYSLVDFAKRRGLADGTLDGVTSWNLAMNSNYVVFAQLFDPPKLEALDYLDGVTSQPPKRYGILTIHRGASSPRDVMQWKIGPLRNGVVDVSDDLVIEKLVADGEIPWSMRGQYGGAEWYLYSKIFTQAAKLADIFRATTGGYCVGDSSCDYTQDIMYHTSGNMNSNSTHRITNVNFFLRPNGASYGSPFLMPIPISFQLVEDPEQDPSEWQVINYEYCFQGPFRTAVGLNNRFNSGLLQTCTVPSSNFDWTLTDSVEPIREDSRIKEPISFHTSGKRYSIHSSTGGRRLDEVSEQHEQQHAERIDTKIAPDEWHISNHLRERFKEAKRQASKEQSKRNRNLQSSGADGTGHQVSWMGWTFHVSSDQMHGLVIRNLKFKGERLAYELSFQEYFASYSSSGSAAGVFYLDSNWEIGALSPLVLGVDCPEDATLLPLVQYYGDEAWVSSDVLCIFEQPYGEAMWRHGFSYNDIGGLPRTALQARVVSTMGNYDYIPTLSLMPDGVMELKLEMGGYLQGGYENDLGMPKSETPAFGTQVRDNVAGLLHDHVIGVKADLDVGGLRNTLMAGKVTYGTYEEATGRPPNGLSAADASLGVKYMDWTTIDTERGISAKDYNSIVITSPTTNSWGAKRGYEIVFHSTIPSQVLPPDHPIGKTTGWQYQNVAITRQKDSERKCAYPSLFNVGTPIPSFDLRAFQQGDDSVVDEDLVFWLMFGAEHYPKAEDVPLVSNFGSGFLLKPRNMYDRAAFEDLSDNRNTRHPVCVAPSIF